MIRHFLINFFVFLAALVLGIVTFTPLATLVGLTADLGSPPMMTMFLVGGAAYGGLILTVLDRLTPRGD